MIRLPLITPDEKMQSTHEIHTMRHPLAKKKRGMHGNQTLWTGYLGGRSERSKNSVICATGETKTPAAKGHTRCQTDIRFLGAPSKNQEHLQGKITVQGKSKLMSRGHGPFTQNHRLSLEGCRQLLVRVVCEINTGFLFQFIMQYAATPNCLKSHLLIRISGARPHSQGQFTGTTEFPQPHHPYNRQGWEYMWLLPFQTAGGG